MEAEGLEAEAVCKYTASTSLALTELIYRALFETLIPIVIEFIFIQKYRVLFVSFYDCLKSTGKSFCRQKANCFVSAQYVLSDKLNRKTDRKVCN